MQEMDERVGKQLTISEEYTALGRLEGGCSEGTL